MNLNDGEKNYYKDNTNPKYIGPGTWSVIHTITYHARVLDTQLQAIKTITTICNYFPCETCREHCLQYIKENPMEEYLINKYKEDHGLFLWSWKFHNTVNYRIGKHIMSWDLANQLYNIDNKVCGKECSETVKTPQTNLKPGTLYLTSKK